VEFLSWVYAVRRQVDYKRAEPHASASGLDPAWVHANYRVGHSAKREFLRDRLVWKADEASASFPTCSTAADGIMPIPVEEEPAPQPEQFEQEQPLL
jgi:hypothetical protein